MDVDFDRIKKKLQICLIGCKTLCLPLLVVHFLLIVDMGVQIKYQRLNKKLKNNIFAERQMYNNYVHTTDWPCLFSVLQIIQQLFHLWQFCGMNQFALVNYVLCQTSQITVFIQTFYSYTAKNKSKQSQLYKLSTHSMF